MISNPTDGINTKNPDDDDDDDDDEKDTHEDEHEDMTTSVLSTEDKAEEGSKAEPEAEGKPESTTMDKMLSEPVQEESGQLRSCLSNFYLISFLVVIAFQFLLEQSS